MRLSVCHAAVSNCGRSFFVTLKGGLLSTAAAGAVSGVCGYLPLATLSQTSAVVALSRTSCPRVGYMACFWLMVMGVVPKIGAAADDAPTSLVLTLVDSGRCASAEASMWLRP